MKTINFSPDGEAISDFKAEERAREFLCGTGDYISVSTDNFILVARCLIREKFISFADIQFTFENKVIGHDADGRMLHYPLGFCDQSTDWLLRLLYPNPE